MSVVETRRPGSSHRPTEPSRLRGIAAVAVTAVVLGIVCGALSSHAFTDFKVYMWGAHHAFSADLYSSRSDVGGLPFTYPPVAAVAFWPLGLLPLPVALAVWTALCFACLAVTLRWALPPHRRSAAIVVGLALAALALEPVRSSFTFGQVNLVVMALLVADVARPTARSRGWLTGIAAGLKLTPLLFVAYFVITRQWRAAVHAGAAFAGTIALGFALNPHGSPDFWLHAMWDPSRVGGVPYAGNQSALGFLTRLLGEKPPGLLWLSIAAALAGLSLLAALGNRSRVGSDSYATALILALGMLLASPITWNHHLVWIAPAMVLLAWSARGARQWLVVAGTTALFVAAPIWWPPRTGDVELRWSPWEQLVGNSYFLYAVAALAVVLVRELPWIRPDRGPTPVPVEQQAR